jgi:hypothetical protein
VDVLEVSEHEKKEKKKRAKTGPQTFRIQAAHLPLLVSLFSFSFCTLTFLDLSISLEFILKGVICKGDFSVCGAKSLPLRWT